MPSPRDPFLPPDDDARQTAARLMAESTTAALGTLHPDTHAPYVTRIALAVSGGRLVTLVSDLSVHTRALRADPRAGLLLGDPPDRGDPLAFARLSLSVSAGFIGHADPGRDRLRADWLARHRKAALYVDFADFHFVAFDILGGHLNGGFARAFALTAQDLKLP